MLGVVIRFDTYHEAEEHMCHVIDVEANSPAELAGLQSQNDFLLGTAEMAFRDTDDLFSVLQANLEKPVEFYVYNNETDEVRVCVLMPSAQWGGEGILGASVAHGYLHSFPSSCCNTLGRCVTILMLCLLMRLLTFIPGTERAKEVLIFLALRNRHLALTPLCKYLLHNLPIELLIVRR